MVFKQEEFMRVRNDFIDDVNSLNKIEPYSDNLESLHKLILSSVVEVDEFIQLADSPNKIKSRLGLSYIANNISNIEESTNKFYSEFIFQLLTFEKQTIQFEEKIEEIKQKKSLYQAGSNLEAIDQEGVLAVCDLKLNGYKLKIENYYKFQTDIERFIFYTIFHAKENIKIRKIPIGEALSVEDGLVALSKNSQKDFYISSFGLLLVVGIYIYNLIASNAKIPIPSRVFSAKEGIPLSEAQVLISEAQLLDHINTLFTLTMTGIVLIATLSVPFLLDGLSSTKLHRRLILYIFVFGLISTIGAFGSFLYSLIMQEYESKLNASNSSIYYELFNIGVSTYTNLLFLVLFLLFLLISFLYKKQVKEIKEIQNKHFVKYKNSLRQESD